MRSGLVKVGIVAVAFSLVAQSAISDELEIKQAIKANGQLVYNKTQKQVDSFSEMFQEGEFYGRLRNNNFYFAYDNPIDGTTTNQVISGLGVSAVYKSATFKGFDVNIGLYGSQAYFDENKIDEISHLKPGKDLVSRYDYANTGSKSLAVIGQANINYKLSKTDFTFGRQLVETFYT